MSFQTIAISSAAVALALYQILPALACRMNRRLTQTRLSVLIKSGPATVSSVFSNIFPHEWSRMIQNRLLKAGYQPLKVQGVYWALICALPLICWLGWLTGVQAGKPALAGILIITLVNSHISRRIRARRKAFDKALFRIYRFLDLQIASGIRVTDAIRGLPDIIQDVVVQPVLLRFAAHFSLTLDLDQAFMEIRQSFPGPDCELLNTQLRQCLQTGEAGRSLLRMEELLFSRYFNMMQAESQQIRTRLLITAILGIAPGIILFLYPLMYEALQAVQSVFG